MAVLFFLLAFVFISRHKLFALKEFAYNIREGFFFGVLAIFSTALYLYSRHVISHDFDYYAVQHYFPSLVFNLLPLLLTCVFFVLAVFNFCFIKKLVHDFRKELGISSLMIVLYYFFNIFVRNSWVFLGSFVSRSVAFLLSLSFNDVILIDKGYNFVLGSHGFVATIGDLCSGVDSMGLFAGLFVLILCYDWKLLNKKRMALIFIPGLLGTVIVNILRIYLLYLVGIFFSADFAVGMFHSNIGVLLFIAYFILFWLVFYRWGRWEN